MVSRRPSGNRRATRTRGNTTGRSSVWHRNTTPVKGSTDPDVNPPEPTPIPGPTPGPTTPALLEAPSVALISPTEADVIWRLDQYATGQVNYGTTTGYGSSSTAESTYQYATHQQRLSGLTPSTTYHFRVRSTNSYGLELVSGDYTFTTPAEATSFDSGMSYTDYTPTVGIDTISALQTWMAANVPDGADSTHHSRILLGAGRTYTGSTGLSLAGLAHVTFEGGGTETQWGQTGGARFILTGAAGSISSSAFRSPSGSGSPAADVRFHCIDILGNSTNYATTAAGDGGEYQMGWALYGASDILIDHCTVDKNKGDGVYLSDLNGGSGAWCSNITVRYTTISNNGRMGLGIIAVDGLLVSFCRFTDICYSPFDLEPNYAGQGFNDAEISDCLIDGTYWSWDSSFEDGCFVTANAGLSGAVMTGYLKVLRNTITARIHPASVGQFHTFFLFYKPTPTTKTAVLTIEDNVCTAPRSGGYAAVVGGWVNGGSIQRNTGFLSSGTWYNDQGGNGSFTISGNT